MKEQIECQECGHFWPLDRFNLERFGEICFKCRANGVSFTYQGSQPGDPKGFWHNTTLQESTREIVDGFKARNNGVEPIPKTTTYYGGVK